VNRILNFSRMEAGKKRYAFAPVDLNSIVDGVLSTYAPRLTEGGFTVSRNLDPSLSPITADRESVAEALINLLDNAMKYSAEEKSISVRTGREKTGAFVDVEDRGIGIAPEHQARIFEKFYRVSSALIHTTKGSGLGLALVRTIMEAHHGSVSVTSRPEEGSTFRLSFPRDRGRSPEALPQEG
jgi:two-component system, OmpR family, phosphate regulon sensor histidine kinase PhoR